MAEAESATEATLRAQSEKTAKFMEVRLIDWLIGWLTDCFLRMAVTIVTESKQINIFCILHVRGRAPQVVKWSVLWEKVSWGGGSVPN